MPISDLCDLLKPMIRTHAPRFTLPASLLEPLDLSLGKRIEKHGVLLDSLADSLVMIDRRNNSFGAGEFCKIREQDGTQSDL
jgi:hypothetical protein